MIRTIFCLIVGALMAAGCSPTTSATGGTDTVDNADTSSMTDAASTGDATGSDATGTDAMSADMGDMDMGGGGMPGMDM